MRVSAKQKIRWHKTKTLGGTGLVTRFYMAGTETLCGGSPTQRCVVSVYPGSSDMHLSHDLAWPLSASEFQFN
jgi:hypothetical protein